MKIWLASLLWALAGAATCPVVDVGPIFSPSRFSQHEVDLCNSQIHDALAEFGVFVAIGHSYSEDSMKEGLESAKELFSLPDDEKMSVSMKVLGGIGRGYLPFGIEAGIAKNFEPKEGFSYGYPHPGGSPDHPLQRPNTWPHSLSSKSIKTFDFVFNATATFAELVSTSLEDHARSNNSDAGQHDDLINYSSIVRGGKSISIMRLFHYFSVDQSHGDIGHETLGSSPHTDWGFLTVIFHDGEKGLQFFHEGSGAWIDVPWIRNSFVVNGGDYLSHLSRGEYHSPIHRVLCPPAGHTRTSFVLFFYPAHNATLPVPAPMQPLRGDTIDGPGSQVVRGSEEKGVEGRGDGVCVRDKISKTGEDEGEGEEERTKAGKGVEVEGRGGIGKEGPEATVERKPKPKVIPFEFNTLLNTNVDAGVGVDVLPSIDVGHRTDEGKVSGSDVRFGDYIMLKWQGVLKV